MSDKINKINSVRYDATKKRLYDSFKRMLKNRYSI